MWVMSFFKRHRALFIASLIVLGLSDINALGTV